MTASDRLSAARLKLGLSLLQVARATGIEADNLEEMERSPATLMSTYSPEEIDRVCRFYGIPLTEMLTGQRVADCIQPTDVVRMILDTCRQRAIPIEVFGDKVGWDLNDILKDPCLIYTNISLDGLRWLCDELGINWLNVLACLASHKTSK